VFTVYVYFKVAAADASDCTRLLSALGCEVSQRVDVREGWVTMMERYRLADAPSPDWLREMHCRARSALGSRTQGERHTEVFVDSIAPG
jgi:hypothetical protein